MANIEEVTNKIGKSVKKNPLLIVGGGVLVLGVWFFSSRGKSEENYIQAETYPENVGQMTGGEDDSGDMGDIVDLLFSLAEENTANMGNLASLIGDGLYSQSSSLADIMASNQEAIGQALSQMTYQQPYMIDYGMYSQPSMEIQAQQTGIQPMGLTMDDYISGSITIRDLAENYAGNQVFETSASRNKSSGSSGNYGNDIIVYSGSGGSTTLKDLANATAPIAESSLRSVTGKSGNLEQQLSGMSSSQKLSALKEAGLIT